MSDQVVKDATIGPAQNKKKIDEVILLTDKTN